MLQYPRTPDGPAPCRRDRKCRPVPSPKPDCVDRGKPRYIDATRFLCHCQLFERSILYVTDRMG